MQEARQPDHQPTSQPNLKLVSNHTTNTAAAKEIKSTVVSFVLTKVTNGLARVARFVEVYSERDE